jgi:outer membrane lipoprotein SlyB
VETTIMGCGSSKHSGDDIMTKKQAQREKRKTYNGGVSMYDHEWAGTGAGPGGPHPGGDGGAFGGGFHGGGKPGKAM